jgi:hypothetical protein
VHLSKSSKILVILNAINTKKEDPPRYSYNSSTSLRLLHKTRPGSSFADDFEKQLRDINAKWEATVRATRQQYNNFLAGRAKLQEIVDK